MQIGMVGLGRMGANMVRRLSRGGHDCVVFDRDAKAVAALASPGRSGDASGTTSAAGSSRTGAASAATASAVTGAPSLAALVQTLAPPRAIWLMLPAAVVDAALDELAPLLAAGDIVIDGGNSSYRDDIRRGAAMKQRQLHYLDVGTSGGVEGLERGYCLMIGGEAEIVAQLAPIFATLAPGIDAAARTPGRQGAGGSAEQGYLHCGQQGAGHFVKMIHNGIEYGIMGAYAEGLNILRHANAGMREHAADAETTPMRDPHYYQYELDLPEIAELWRRGSVIASWLLDLIAGALLRDPQLDSYAGRVSDSGEGRWTLAAAIDEAVPAPVLSAALFQRFSSRGQAEFSDKLLSAMRQGFGGHAEVGGAAGKPE